MRNNNTKLRFNVQLGVQAPLWSLELETRRGWAGEQMKPQRGFSCFHRDSCTPQFRVASSWGIGVNLMGPMLRGLWGAASKAPRCLTGCNTGSGGVKVNDSRWKRCTAFGPNR